MSDMNTPFGGDRQRRRNREPALSDLPAWGLEIMMGLYGPETIGKACGEERDRAPVATATRRRVGTPAETRARVGPAAPPERCDETRAASIDPVCSAHPVSPLVLQLEAVNELVRFVERRFKRH